MVIGTKDSATELEQKIAVRRDVLLQIKTLLIDRLQLDLTPDDIDDDTFLIGSGLELDSIDAMEIVIAMEADFGVVISDGDMTSLRTVNTLADLVVAQMGK